MPIIFKLIGTRPTFRQKGLPGIIRGRANRPPVAGWTITGTTKDSTGAALAACAVDLFETTTDALRGATTSDGTGAYSFSVNATDRYYAVAYKAGAPDVAGTTVNTLTGA